MIAPTEGQAVEGAAPRAALLQMIMGFALAPMLYVAVRLGLADRLADGPVEGHEVARNMHVDGDSLQRLMLTLASHGVFAREGESFRLTSLGELLRTGPGSLRATALYWGSPWVWNAWSELLGSIETGRPAFDMAHGQDFFGYLATHRDASSIFDNLMTETTTQRHLAIAETYDFAAGATVVDVGGGRGATLAAVLRRHPTLRGVLCDKAVEVAKAGAAERTPLDDPEFAGRFEVVAGDFFTAVPMGGNYYILSNILHDWSDARALDILLRCRRAMPASAKLLVVERVIDPGADDPSARTSDMFMLALLGGRERTAYEFAELFDEAGFAVTRILPTASPFSIVEGGSQMARGAST